MSAQRSGRRRLQPSPPVQESRSHQATEPFALSSVAQAAPRVNEHKACRPTYGTRALEVAFFLFIGIFAAAFFYLAIWLIVIVLSLGLEMAGA